MRLEFDVLENTGCAKQYSYLHIQNSAYPMTLRTLVDTGAFFSVWVDGMKTFKLLFPDAYKLPDTKVIIGGFGGKGGYKDVYIIPKFYLGDDNGNRLEYINMPVAVGDYNFSVKMILGYPIFNKMNIYRTCFDEKGRQTLPRLVVETLNNSYTVGISRYIDDEKSGIVSYTSIFAQENSKGRTNNQNTLVKSSTNKLSVRKKVTPYETRVVRYKGSYISKRQREHVFAIEVDGKEVSFIKKGTIKTRDNHIEYVYRDKRYRLVLGSSSNLTSDLIKYLFDGAKTN